jgi:GDPmannose 4,6-dehydratase
VPVALITGVTGQDGSYLAELLLGKGYEVHGLVRRSSAIETTRISHLLDKEGFTTHYGDMYDSLRLYQILNKVKPDEVYNLAAQSHVRVSFDDPEGTADSTAMGSVRLLEAIRESGLPSKYYQASSAEMFGSSPPPQGVDTPFRPQSPYGVSKVFSYWMTKTFRESYGMFACNGILFNHESPRRGSTFVTRKITRAAAAIANGSSKKLYLGNLDAVRDWGYTPDYVEAMWRILQLPGPEDFVVATGTQYTIRDFLSLSFNYVGLDWEDHVEIDERLLRPAEVDALVGDYSKLNTLTGWSPTVYAPELATIMVDHDIRLIKDPSYVDVPMGAGWQQ